MSLPPCCRDATQAFTSPAAEECRQRAARLDCLVCLRRLYRNIIRAKAYQAAPVGIYMAQSTEELAEMLTEEDRLTALEDRKQQALRVLADIQLTIDQLEARSLAACTCPADFL